MRSRPAAVRPAQRWPSAFANPIQPFVGINHRRGEPKDDEVIPVPIAASVSHRNVSRKESGTKLRQVVLKRNNCADYPKAGSHLETWRKVVRTVKWKSLVDVRKTYRSASDTWAHDFAR